VVAAFSALSIETHPLPIMITKCCGAIVQVRFLRGPTALKRPVVREIGKEQAMVYYQAYHMGLLHHIALPSS